jgi:hypothetical protein
MSHVDGNALAGELTDALGIDPTPMRATCAHCGTATILAQTLVTFDGPGPVAHCPTCAGIMLRMLRTDGEVSVDIRGIRALGMPRHDKRAE